MTINTPKLLVMLALIASLTTLMALGAVTTDAGMPPLTMIVGYAVGNGITARKGQTAEPIVSANPPGAGRAANNEGTVP